MNLLERFLKYVSIDTTSNSKKQNSPTSNGQIKLAKLLVNELKEIGMDDIYYDEKHCYVYAHLLGDKRFPKIGFISHMDTSEDVSGVNIQPKVINNYDGKDIILNNGIVLSTKMYPEIIKQKGKTIITTDGTTLLGADDKCGIAEIMSMLEFVSSSDIKHGDIYIAFTPDEEIGLTIKNFDFDYFKVDYAYTVDGSALGQIKYENFNGATIDIDIKGFATHLGYAKGIMINAARIATLINSYVPNELPENTDGSNGFYYLKSIEGNLTSAHLKYYIRDFDKSNFELRKKELINIVNKINKEYNNCARISIEDTFCNMYEYVSKHHNLIENTLNAIKKVGVKPLIEKIRGATDGSDISEKGIPCPNLGTGAYNHHSIFEYASLNEMKKTVEILISIIKESTKKND